MDQVLTEVTIRAGKSQEGKEKPGDLQKVFGGTRLVIYSYYRR